MDARDSIVDLVLEDFAGQKSVVADAVAEIAAWIGLAGGESLAGLRKPVMGIPGH